MEEVSEPAAKSRRQEAAQSKTVLLNYQEPPPEGFRTGRYINQPDRGDAIDVHLPTRTKMHNARLLSPPATLETAGFTLQSWPTNVANFNDKAEVEDKYYAEVTELVKTVTGASRVLVFDHTVRSSQKANLNSVAGETAAPVPRVHCDYTAESAPRRLAQFAGIGDTPAEDRLITEAEYADLASRRFAFVNVWRSTSDAPVQRMPLAVCDTRSVPESDHFLYELIFPNRVGENYSLRFSEAHRWHYYPQMTKDECILFKVYDKEESGPRFTFHTAFDDPSTPADAPPRESVEVRTIAFFEGKAEKPSETGPGGDDVGSQARASG